MGLTVSYTNGQTPLDEEEKDGLLIKTITTHGELNEVEQLNIEEAVEWTLRRKRNIHTVLSEEFVCTLHKKMYNGVWRWAGQFRKSNKNIGVDKYQIQIELLNLLRDCIYWIENKTFPEDEIAVRFKHKIVLIHCFPNGNGRHSRLIADVIINHLLGKPVFSWGAQNLRENSKTREDYLAALREADKGDLTRLIRFSRS